MDLDALGDEIGDVVGDDAFYCYSQDNLSLQDCWVDIGGRFVDVGLRNEGRPDITAWNGANLVLNEKTYNALRDVLAPFGEFLPISLDEVPYHVFNCMRVVDVNAEESEQELFNGEWVGVVSIAFHNETIRDKLVFKTTFDQCSAI